jgi:RHS repeat-associated protein
LIGDNCGSGWAQTFSYDNYGNLTKAGSVAFNPGYNTKNQYTTIGATYDAAGNLTYDGTNAIAWDGFGKMMSFAGVSYKYDAFGRVVTDVSGKDILYGPLGEIGVIVYPNTLYHTYIPLPGGSTYSMSNGGRHYPHRDLLGTSAVVSSVPTSGNGTVASDLMFAPYGDQYDIHGTISPMLFAGNGSDLNASLYDTPNRELSVVGRWLSPDPADATWSAYAYVSDPTMQVDNTGLFEYSGGDEPSGVANESGLENPRTSDLWEGGAGNDPAPPYKIRVEVFAKYLTPLEEMQMERLLAQNNNGQVTAKVKGKTVTYTYPDGSKVVLKGTHAWRDNNPGDLKSGYDSIGRDGRGKSAFAIYESADDGWSALGQTLTGKYGDSTIADTMKAFAPASDNNNPVKYAATLAASVGVPVSTKISALTPAQFTTVEINIGVAEGYFAAKNSEAYSAPPQ